MHPLRIWLTRYGWVVIIAVMILLGIWSLVDEQAVKWTATALLVVGMTMLAGRAVWSASRTSRE